MALRKYTAWIGSSSHNHPSLRATMSTEHEPLLSSEESGQRNYARDDAEFADAQHRTRTLHIRSVVWTALGIVFVVGVVLALFDPGHLGDKGWTGKLPKDANLAARRLLDSAPIIVRIRLFSFCCAADVTHRMVILVGCIFHSIHS